MTHTRQMADSEGAFGAYRPAEAAMCHKCKSNDVEFRLWESSCGGYEDLNYHCKSCDAQWWVDGIDS